jgi:UDP-N-acetylmuramate dehydrogenase
VSKEQVIKKLETILKNGDVIFTMGAGDVYKLKDKIIKLINSKQNKNFKLKIEKNKELRQFNTLRINSVAEYFLDAKTREDLIEGVRFAHKNKLQLFILAGGSNLAIIKEKISGLVIKNNYKQLKILEESDKEVLISVSSGYPVSLLVNETVNKGYEGFEYHKGLPGTVGGAIYGNSKWTKPISYFGDSLVMSYLVTESGEVKQVDRDYFKFDYDYSILQKTKEILLEAVFKLKKVDSKILKERAEKAFNYRKESQPMGIATSGCFFKNVDGRSSGQLIDQAGLKNFSVGDFYISPKHANFIINRGQGQAKDLIKLVRIIKEKVKQKFGVEIEEEVILI